jgi:hypothetical protein
VFADCNSESSRQRTFKKKYFLSLPTVELAASRQTIFEKNSLPTAEELAVGKACRQG